MINTAKWIWPEGKYDVNEYADFICEFDVSEISKNSNIKISVDSEYVLYINGEFVSVGQYSDFPENKKFDEIDIANYLKIGKNKIAITAYYQGESTSRYLKGERAGDFCSCKNPLFHKIQNSAQRKNSC